MDENGQIPIIEFGDLDRDAMTDMIFYSFGSIYTFYNRYDANDANADSLCRDPYPGSYLVSSPIFTPIISASLDQQNVTIQNLTKTDATSMGIQQTSAGTPGRIRLGDIDADGFPELLISIRYKYINTGTEYISTTIYKSDLCTPQNCSVPAAAASRRYFEVNPFEYNTLHDFTQASTSLSAFVDIDEDGRLDLLIQKKNVISGQVEVYCIYNNYVKDTFFIKAMMVNTQGMYGDSSIGSSYRLIVTDLNDNKFVVISTQMPQTSYNSLSLPYCYLGVGRSNNYVETFTAAFSIAGQRSIRVWTPIIPNSQLIIFA